MLVAKQEGLAEPYLVGGALRDMIRGVEPKDYDITCGNKDSVSLGYAVCSAFGTTAHKMHSGSLKTIIDGFEFDFSPHFIYEDKFQDSLKNETASRDFTINTLLMRLSNGEIIDFFGAIGDIKEQRLVWCCTPDADPVRRLRAIKFIADGFVPDEQNLKSLIDNFDISSVPTRQARQIINSAIRKNPEITLFLVENHLLKKVPLSKLMIETLKNQRRLHLC